MVLVDTSIWIDFFQNPHSTYNKILETLILNNNKAVICSIILQEILQGIKDNKSYIITKNRLSRLPFINTTKETYLYASSLYRILRREGITILSMDITIASISIGNKIPLFTNDNHFGMIAKYSDLRLYRDSD